MPHRPLITFVFPSQNLTRDNRPGDLKPENSQNTHWLEAKFRQKKNPTWQFSKALASVSCRFRPFSRKRPPRHQNQAKAAGQQPNSSQKPYFGRQLSHTTENPTWQLSKAFTYVFCVVFALSAQKHTKMIPISPLSQPRSARTHTLPQPR